MAFLFYVLVDLVGYTVARLILPLVSFGKVYVQPFFSPSSTERKFNALGFRRDDNGRIEIEETIAGFVGFIICLIAFFAIGLLASALS